MENSGREDSGMLIEGRRGLLFLIWLETYRSDRCVMHDYGKSRYGQQLRRFVDGKFYRVPLLNRCMPFMKIIIYFLFGGSEMFVGELKLAVLE